VEACTAMALARLGSGAELFQPVLTRLKASASGKKDKEGVGFYVCKG